MLSNDRKKIILMNPVRVDYALNKYNKKSTKEMDASGVSTSGFDANANAPMSWGGVGVDVPFGDSSSVGVGDDHV